MNATSEKAIQFTKVAGRVIALAQRIVNEKQASDNNVSGSVEKVAKALRQAGLIDESEVKEAMAELSSHGDSLSVLNNVIGEYVKARSTVKAAAVVDMGKAEPVSNSSSYGKLVKQSNYVGRRLGEGEFSEADMRMISRLIPGWSANNQ